MRVGEQRTRYGIRNTQLAAGVLLVASLTACQATPATPYAVPTLPRAPQVTVTPFPVTPTAIMVSPTPSVAPPTPTRMPTLAVTPTAVPVALDKWQTFESPDKTFTFLFPPDWGGRWYTQVITRTVFPLTVDTVLLRGPGGATGPEYVLMYNWPALDPTQPPNNLTAWSSVAGLAKLFLYPNCMTTFDSPAPLTLSGQETMGAKFVVQCDHLYAGYLVGIVHKRVNYGLVMDVPVEDWDAWRPTFETMTASFTLNP